MARQRQRLAFVFLSVFALLGQLLLPNAHAQSWAQRGGDPLLYAFCGQVSPTLAAQLRKVAPPELIEKLQSDQQLSQSSCSLCPSLHAGHLAGGTSPVLAVLADAVAAQMAAILPAAPQALRVVLPQLRGPPALA